MRIIVIPLNVLPTGKKSNQKQAEMGLMLSDSLLIKIGPTQRYIIDLRERKHSSVYD